MPTYKYTAKDMRGRTIKGEMVAANTGQLIEELRGRNIFLIESHALDEQVNRRRLKALQLAEFNLQLGTMLRSGVSLIRAMEIVLERDATRREHDVYAALLDQLVRGMSISEAMANMGGVFPPLLVSMYRAGEANGTIDLTALKMAEHYQKEHRLQSKIKSASTYPKILAVLLVLVVFAVFNFILPQFLDLYGDTELPGITRAVIAVSKLFTDYLLYTAIAVLLLVLGFSLLKQNPRFRLWLDRTKLRLPVIGRLMRIIATARFARTLSSLYASGLTMLNTLAVAKGTVGNAYIEAQFDDAITDVRNGNPLSYAVSRIDGYDKKLASIILVGEETGRLDEMLNSVADTYDYEAQQAADRLTAMLEPALIVLMALIIGLVMIAVMLPIYNLYGSIEASGGYY